LLDLRIIRQTAVQTFNALFSRSVASSNNLPVYRRLVMSVRNLIL
jgi:hypothetical protein